MHGRSVPIWAFLLLMCMSDAVHGEERAAPNRHALLIGVTHYPRLTGCDLKGPANDVILMSETLQKKFRFSPQNIATLSEAEGATHANNYPNRACIEREFKRLAATAKAGDQVVILMAGHGSQQPEAENSPQPEADGLDEIFLPRDCGPWAGEGANAKVENAIVDDDMALWLKAIQDRGASVWLIMDSCHSGTMSRGVAEVARQVPTDANSGLKIPAEVLAKAKKRAAERRTPGETSRGVAPPPGVVKIGNQAGLVAIYACQPHETTVEREMPPESAEQKPYGLLTYTINQVLNQSESPLSYDELLAQVQARYTHMRRTAPTPMIEGPDRKREVLGAKQLQRSAIAITESQGKLSINAGRLHGLTTDSVLAVYPPPGKGKADAVLGHVRILKALMSQSEVEPAEFEGRPAPATDAMIGGRCEIAAIDYGDAKLRVAVEAADPAAAKTLQEALAKIAGERSSLVVAVKTATEADWVIRGVKEDVHLIRASEAAGESTPFNRAPRDARLQEWLKVQLHTIARAENLLRTASNPGDLAMRGSVPSQVELSLVRLKDETDAKGTPAPFPNPRFQPGDIVRYQLHNPSRTPMDVTVLYIDSRYGVTPIFPLDGENNRLQPGDRLQIPPSVVGDETTGRENVVVLAVKGTGDRPSDFTLLAQPSLEQARATAKGLKHPLLDLCEGSVYGVEGKRGAPRRALVDTFHLQVIPLEVLPAKPK